VELGLLIFPTDLTIDPVTLGREAEDRGFESLWFPEHSHIPTSRATPWGGREGAPPLPEEYWRTHEQFTALAAIAFLMAIVKRMSLLPFVIYRLILGIILLWMIYTGALVA